MLIDKEKLPLVAVQSMNDTHMRETDIINELFVFIERKRAGDAVDEQLNEWVNRFDESVEQHFRGEEALMLEYGFPAFPIHKAEHDRVLRELNIPLDAWRNDGDIEPLAAYLQDVHPQWATNHIATMDTMTAYFISQSGK